MFLNFALGLSAFSFALLAYHQVAVLQHQFSGLLLLLIALGQGALLLRQTVVRQRSLLLAGVSAIGLGILAQYRQIAVHEVPGILALTAALLWIIFLVQPAIRLQLATSGSIPLPSQPFQWTGRRGVLILLGSGLLLSTVLLAMESGQFSLPLLISWLSGLAIWWMALQAPDDRAFHLPRLRFRREYLLVIAVLLIGGLSFFYRLDNAPQGMLGDHASILRDVDNIGSNSFPIFFRENFGREPIHFYLSYLNSSFYGLTFLDLKVVSALMAMGTLLALYWAGQQIDGQLSGLLTMALGALSLYLMIMARNGFRAGGAALMTALLLGALWRALHSGHRSDFMLAGLILGIGLYTYTAFRMMPLLVVLGIFLRLLSTAPRHWPRLLLNAAALVLIAAMVYAPLFGYWQYDPQGYWSRTDHLFHDASLDRLWFGFYRALGLFNVFGDVVWFNTVPGRPALGPVSGALFLFGLALWLWRAVLKRRPTELLLPLAVLICVLPSALAVGAPIELPNALRTITALPVVLLLGGTALALVVRSLAQQTRGGLLAGISFAALILLAHGALNWDAYFNHFVPSYNRGVAREYEAAQQILAFAKRGGSIWNSYFVTDDAFIDIHSGTIAAQLGYARTWHNYFGQVDLQTCAPAPAERPLLFIIAPLDSNYDQQISNWLETCFETYDLQDYYYAPGDRLFEIAQIER